MIDVSQDLVAEYFQAAWNAGKNKTDYPEVWQFAACTGLTRQGKLEAIFEAISCNIMDV
ncbi:MAG TPA: hypothetical protein GXZ64_04735 [Clostridiaceae bacterium]|nr:hypothetical protein [Clostridiaceae bacterium]